MATSTFKWNAIKGLAMRVIGNKFTETVVMKILAFQVTYSQTWAVVVNSILGAAHVSIGDVADSRLRVRSATLILQVAQSKITHLFALASKFDVQGKGFKISIPIPTKWKVSFPIFAHREFVHNASTAQIQELVETICEEAKPLAWSPITKEIWTPQGKKRVKTGALVAIFDKKRHFVDENKLNGEFRDDNLCFRWRVIPPVFSRTRESRMR